MLQQVMNETSTHPDKTALIYSNTVVTLVEQLQTYTLKAKKIGIF